MVKTYGHGETVVGALRGVSLKVESGDYVAIMGVVRFREVDADEHRRLPRRSDLGPVPGLNGVDVSRLSDRQLAHVRNRRIGFIFQAFNLIPRTTALANVELPLAYAGIKAAERRRRARAALELVGLADRAGHDPNELSGGQQQRVAVARALVTAPALLLADEPTGNLDTQSTGEIMSVLDRLHRSGRTILLITHEPDVAAHARRLIRLVDGRIVEDAAQRPIVRAMEAV